MKAPLPPISARTLTTSVRSKRTPRALLLAAVVAAAVVGACGGQSEQEGPANGDGDGGDGDNESGGSGGGDGDGVCAPGSEGCECYGNGTCDARLSCLSNLCVDAGSTGGSGGGEECACDGEQSCVDGECVDWVCEPDERFCSGDSVRLCAADGLSSEEDEECQPGYYCNAESAECLEGVCAPDEPACDGNSARWCNAAGTGYEPGGILCTSDETCDAGVCEAHVCPPGDSFCDGQQVMACAESGLTSSLVEVCEDGASSVCVESTGQAACLACTPGDTRCSGNGVQTCVSPGAWSDAVACADQACLESDGSASCEGVCEPGQTQCSGNSVQTCTASGAWGTATACSGATPDCSAGTCGQPPSCQGLAATCGPNGNESCCTSLPVTGGTFYRGTDTNYPATISDFRLDKYEVTVGRFRKFAAAWNDGYRPATGAGKHTHLGGGEGLTATAGGNEAGWDTAWAVSVDTSDTARGTVDADATWTNSAGASESRPINFVNWFESAAFCIWDGGFLPSEAEWEYAAAGGAAERTYPWGGATPTCSYAIFYDNGAYCEAGVPYSAPVGGRSPTGDGLWGQSDLSGNLREWTLDWLASPFNVTCNNCGNVVAGSSRVVRGGYWNGSATYLSAANRSADPPASRYDGIGLRCARTP